MKPLLAIIESIYEMYPTKSYGRIEEDIIYSAVLLTLREHGVRDEQIKKLDADKLLKAQECRAYSLLESDDLKEFWYDYMVLSRIYEYIVGKRINKKEKYSIYYTPEWIVQYIVDGSVNEALLDYHDLEDIKILEPACGCGVFLAYIFDLLYELYLDRTNYDCIDICRYIIQNNLYGIDVDPRAIEICRYLLMIKVFKKTGKLNGFTYNLFADNFLTEPLFSKNHFDLIIGNPPYLENRGLNKYFDKEYMKKNFRTAIGRFDIYGLFIEKSILLLKKGGYLYFVVPGNLLSNNNFAPVRRFILENSSITSIINLGEGIFEDVGMNMIIISMHKDISTADDLIICKNISNSEDKKRDIKIKEHKEIPQRFYENTLLNVFDIDSSYETFKLREKIYNDCSLRIKDVAEVVAGIATGNVRKKLLTTNENRTYAKKVLEGKNVQRFCHQWSGIYFIDDKSIINRSKGEYATFMREDMINKEKLIIRQTADKFICSYDNERYYILNTLYSLVIKGSYENTLDIKYVLALLNSKLFHFLYSTLIREKGKLFPQLKIFHIQYSPIKIPHENIQQKIRSLVDEIILLNTKIYAKDDLDSMVIIEHEKRRDSLNLFLDEIIFQVFSLNSKEIEIINREIN
ncbi:N-6 DNA methylase [Proteiniborus sp. MB09-C3]|uniref:Eco57I restriction-modification methylase domain-containing protein n=1 Tax=Proteiniborus sp. MB09-C3 TaxID=3050072 RepID=UPI0025544AD0|nr:N-6 DNA methylase [Proteiniborus sp. MB09-C3]WIV11424.1 N-6 DNA methylase [Proteiniborus sp. MB09-C3]